MSSDFVVRTIDEYLALPELPMPSVPSEEAPGRVYRVLKIGFYMATQAECEAHGLEAMPVPERQRYALPTTVVEIEKKKEFFRLPHSLASWAFDAVAVAHAIKNPFPCDVEFGILRDRHYAEIL